MILKKKIKEVTTKYTWKFWGLVIGEITFIVIFILLFGLSIKALVQDIQINTYKYKSEGTVTVAEFYGKHGFLMVQIVVLQVSLAICIMLFILIKKLVDMISMNIAQAM